MKRLMLLTGSLFAAVAVFGQPSLPGQPQPDQSAPPPGAGATIIQTNALTATNALSIPMISEYIIVTGTNASDLTTNVQQKVVSGYQPFGDVFHLFSVDTNSNTRTHEYGQPMIKYGQ